MAAGGRSQLRHANLCAVVVTLLRQDVAHSAPRSDERDWLRVLAADHVFTRQFLTISRLVESDCERWWSIASSALIARKAVGCKGLATKIICGLWRLTASVRT
jgi:hypothetical protein